MDMRPDNGQNVGLGLVEVFVRVFFGLLVIDIAFTCVAIVLGLPAWPG